ncbi:MAG: hypothetical protein ACJ788_12395 [Ktedonobacteraceae bacterium]
MPLTPTSAVGRVGIVIEGTSGEQVLLAPVVAIATNTGIAAPTGSTGMKLHVYIKAWLTSGSFTILGTGTPASTETVTVPAPTAQQLQAGATFEYVSVNNYTAITNITTTGGVTGALLSVGGIQAAKFNIPTTKFVSKRKVPKHSPNEFTGLMARDKKLIDQINETSIDSFDTDFYGDLSLYWVYLMLGVPNWTTVPAAPVSIVASATITASMTIAAQPTAPGMKLIVTVTGFTASPSLTIIGTSYGLTVTETITPTANGTYYSANVYSAITSIGGTINATNVTVTGVFGWKGTVTEEATSQTAAIEHFDGSASWTHPFSYMTDGDMTIKVKGEVGLTLKGMAQDKIAIGDRTTNPLQVSRVTSLGIPLADLPVAGWQTQVYLDAITGTAQTTVFLDADEEIKIALKTPVEQHHTFNNTQNFTRAYPNKEECTVNLTYDIINLLQNEQFRQNLKQYLCVAVLGQYIGTSATVAFYKGWTWTLPVRYDGEYGQEAEPNKGNTYAKPKLRCEYDAAIGGSYLLTIITQNPPTYNL